MGKDRKEQILDAALEVAELSHYQLVDFAGAATQAGVSRQLVKYYFHTVPEFRVAMLERAIEMEKSVVIGQGERTGEISA